MGNTRRFCTFRLDQFLFGIDVEHVQEVLRQQEMTRVPLAPREVKGLINLRGQIFTALDLRTRLAMAPREGERPAMNVILRADGGGVALLVDEIEDVVGVDEDFFEAPPNQLSGEARQLVNGVFKLDGRLLLVLDAHRAAEVSKIGRAEQGA
jgi:purine-binding chemotaxis protein CheW